MDDTPQPVDAKTLKFLRVLVTVLTATMILGLLVLIGLFVTRFPDLERGASEASMPPGLELPSTIHLPEGVKPRAFTRGESWFAVVTDDDRILIYGTKTGQLIQEVDVVSGN
ncbi:MAG: DUF6476 family protein [Paracoccaceae bacterium]